MEGPSILESCPAPPKAPFQGHRPSLRPGNWWAHPARWNALDYPWRHVTLGDNVVKPIINSPQYCHIYNYIYKYVYTYIYILWQYIYIYIWGFNHPQHNYDSNMLIMRIPNNVSKAIGSSIPKFIIKMGSINHQLIWIVMWCYVVNPMP